MAGITKEEVRNVLERGFAEMEKEFDNLHADLKALQRARRAARFGRYGLNGDT